MHHVKEKTMATRKKKDSIELALQNLNTIRQKTKGKVDIRSMINEGRKY